MIVGLTGSSGSGKSTVARIFAQFGFLHIDADGISKKVAQPGTACLTEIAEHFGKGVLAQDGSLNRKSLGEIVFRDEGKLKELNKITHKYILAHMEKQIREAPGDVLLDAPLLFEADLHLQCDFTVAVIADSAAQIRRISERDGISEETASKRLDNQHSNEFFIRNCTYCIENMGTQEELEEKTKQIIFTMKGEKAND